MLRYLLYKTGKFLVIHLPCHVSLFLAQIISDLHYFFHIRDKNAVKKNMKRIIPSNNHVSEKARDMFRNFGRYLVEFLSMDVAVNSDFIQNHVKVENLGYMKEAISQGKGGIILTAHVGNWELGALVLSQLGYPLTVIALPHKHKLVNDFFNHQRESKGNIRVVSTNIAARKCLNELKENHLIAVAGDRDFFQNGELCNFLGQKTMLPKGAAVFSLKTGAPIIPMFFIRKNKDEYLLTISAPIYPPALSENKSERKDGVKSIMNRYIPIIEGIIKQYPSQWLMFRDYAAGV